MISKKMEIINSVGLHLRPAGIFTSEMMKFECNVTIIFGEERINAKSVISVMAAGIKCGSEIVVECDGPDEAQALSRADELISGGFYGL